MPRPICLRCEVEFKLIKNAYILLLMATETPYMLYHSDRYQCPRCEAQIAIRAVVGRQFQPPEVYTEVYDARYWNTIKDQQRGLAMIDEVELALQRKRSTQRLEKKENG